jgi:hypothetical protein
MKLAIACCVTVVALVSAPAWGRPAAPATVRADVGEWSVVPSVGVVPAGRVRIEVRNLGQVAHQLVLVKTDSFDPVLRLRGDRALVHPLATSVLVRPGRTSAFVVSLRRGSYLLLDNLPWRYWKGTSVAFSVR